jgi:hypothetical protein
MKVLALITFVLGCVFGAAILPFQHYLYNMEAPNLWWLLKVPCHTVAFGIIFMGIAVITTGLLQDILELFRQGQTLAALLVQCST